MSTTTDTTFDRDAYVDKVRKLLAKAEGAATAEEAAAFFGKAQDLITKWEIAEAELRDAQQAGPASWAIERRSYPLSSYSPVQDSMAMQFVARAMGLSAYEIPYVRGFQTASTEVFGTTEDLDRFDMMWASVSLQMIRFMRAGESPGWNRNEQRRWRLGFKVGFGKRVGERIAAARDHGTKHGTAIVLAGKQDAIQAALPPLKTRSVKTDANANAAGAAAANRADLGVNARVNGKARTPIGAGSHG